MERIHRIMLIIIVCVLVTIYFGPSCVEAFGSGIAEIGPFGVTDLGYSGFVKGAAEVGVPNQFESLIGVPTLMHEESAHVVSTPTHQHSTQVRRLSRSLFNSQLSHLASKYLHKCTICPTDLKGRFIRAFVVLLTFRKERCMPPDLLGTVPKLHSQA